MLYDTLMDIREHIMTTNADFQSDIYELQSNDKPILSYWDFKPKHEGTNTNGGTLNVTYFKNMFSNCFNSVFTDDCEDALDNDNGFAIICNWVGNDNYLLCDTAQNLMIYCGGIYENSTGNYFYNKDIQMFLLHTTYNTEDEIFETNGADINQCGHLPAFRLANTGGNITDNCLGAVIYMEVESYWYTNRDPDAENNSLDPTILNERKLVFGVFRSAASTSTGGYMTLILMYLPIDRIICSDSNHYETNYGLTPESPDIYYNTCDPGGFVLKYRYSFRILYTWWLNHESADNIDFWAGTMSYKTSDWRYFTDYLEEDYSAGTVLISEDDYRLQVRRNMQSPYNSSKQLILYVDAVVECHNGIVIQ